MKKHFFLLTSLLAAAFFTVQAQTKTQTITALSTSEHSAKAAVHPAVLANFKSQYPGAVDDSWLTMKKGYVVRFSSNDLNYDVFLDKNGRMTSQVRYCHEKDLPTSVLNMVKSFGGCFTIDLIREVTTQLGTAYLVTIDEGSTWKVIRIAGDEMDVFEEHKKG